MEDIANEKINAIIGKLCTPRNVNEWAKQSDMHGEQEQFLRDLLWTVPETHGYPAWVLDTLVDELNHAFDYEYSMMEYDKRFHEDTPSLDAPWWHQK